MSERSVSELAGRIGLTRGPAGQLSGATTKGALWRPWNNGKCGAGTLTFFTRERTSAKSFRNLGMRPQKYSPALSKAEHV
jgi:hypothetical protein